MRKILDLKSADRGKYRLYTFCNWHLLIFKIFNSGRKNHSFVGIYIEIKYCFVRKAFWGIVFYILYYFDAKGFGQIRPQKIKMTSDKYKEKIGDKSDIYIEIIINRRKE